MTKTQKESETLKILVVCLGNLCRSPFAERLFKKKIPKDKLKVEVFSRGTMAEKASSPPSDAVEAAKRWGIDLSDHRSHPLDLCDINTSDLILTMDSVTAETLNDLCELNDTAVPLGRFYPDSMIIDIEDPYGKGLKAYLRCYETIEKCVEGFVSFYAE